MASVSYRLHRAPEISEVLRRGRRRQTRFLRLVYRTGVSGPARFAVVVGRRVGGAVFRNRVKRRLRAVLRDWAKTRRGVDLVVVCHPAISELEAAEGRRLMTSLLDEEGLS